MKAKRTGILLTIGMIVKNEEKYLPRCLEALRPLREALPCELIITDTGSTDRTLEIAARYADELRHFMWCGDYAAARNTTLENISGEWYMYLDADEILDPDISELVDFFKSGLCRSFTAAALRMQNYAEENRPGDSFYPVRIFKCTPGMHFEDKVHEHMVCESKTARALQTTLHHYGYMTEISRMKQLRYRPMMLEALEKDPDNPRNLRHLADGYDPHIPQEAAERVHILEKLIALCEAGKGQKMRAYAYLTLMRTQWVRADYQGVLDTIQRYFETKPSRQDSAVDVDVYAMRGFSLFNLKQYESALDAFEKYRVLYQAFQRKLLDVEDMTVVALTTVKEEYWTRSLYVCAQCCAARGDFGRAKRYIDQIDIVSLATTHTDLSFLGDEFQYIRDSGDFTRMGALCAQILAKGSEDAQICFFHTVEKSFPAFDKQKLEIVRVLAAVEGNHPFLHLHRMRVALADDNYTQAGTLANALLTEQNAVSDPYFADILYCVMLCGLPFGPALDAFGAALEEALNILAEQRADFDTAVCAAFDREPFPQNGTPGELFRRTRVMILALLRGESAQEDRRDQLADFYIREIISFCEQIYNLDAIPTQDRFVLPVEHRFAVGMREANVCLEQGDLTACLQMLQTLLESCPTMHRLIKRRLEQVSSRMEAVASVHNEFDQLAFSVKQQFYSLLKAGQRDVCAEVLDAYAAVNPNDPEIDVMRRDFEQSFR